VFFSILYPNMRKFLPPPRLSGGGPWRPRGVALGPCAHGTPFW